MATILFTLSTGEVMPSTDPYDTTDTDTVGETLSLIAQVLTVAADEGISFMIFPDDRTGKDRVLGLSQIVAVDVKVESPAVQAVRDAEHMPNPDALPGGVL